MRPMIALFLAVSLASAQAPTPQPAPPAGPPPKTVTPPTSQAGAMPEATQKPATAVAPDTVVLTLPNVCEKPAADGSCATKVTRAQFEAMLGAVAPPNATAPADLPPSAKRQIATSYASLLAVATEAERRDLAKSADVQELLRISRMQALARALTAQLQRNSAPSDAEVEAYYKANAGTFEQATLQRIVVPVRPASQPKPAAKKPAAAGAKAAPAGPLDEKGLAALAKQIHAKAQAGASFDTLQKQAYTAAGAPNAPVNTQVVVRRNSLAANHQSVFELKPGSVSPLFTEPSGHYIYKLVSKQATPLDQAKAEIVAQLGEQKFRESMESLLKKSAPEMNEAYFGPGMTGFGTMRETTPGAPAQPPAQTTPPQQPPTPK